MTETLVPYARMRAVAPTRAWNVRWIEELPPHWDFVSSKWLFRASGELARDGDEQLSATQAYGVISQKTYQERIGRKITQITKNLEKRKHVEADDFVISMRSFEGGIERAWESGCIRSSYIVLQAGPLIHVPFFQYLFKCHPFIQALQSTSNFIRDGQDLNLKNFHLIDLPVPPLPEQIAAAKCMAFVDRTTKKLIHAKARLIRLLNEQRQAIIHRAVTRGLDETAPLKPSGIDWLGNIPAHWEVRRLKTLLRDTVDTRDARGDDEIYIALEHVESWSGRLLKEDCETTFDSKVKAFQTNDILFGKLRPYLAKVLLSKRTGVCVGEFLVLRGMDEKFCPEFLEQRLRARDFIDLVNSSTFGAKMPRADWTFIGATHIALPPDRDEQHEILNRIASETADLDTAIAQIQSEIALIREYRTRLIADLVTGKLDVRALAATLPDTAPDDLAPDADDLADDMLEADETMDEDAEATA